MARDPIESIAVIPNPTDNFDEVWAVVNRANGRFVERMAARLSAVDCGDDKTALLSNQIFMDSAIQYDTSFEIASITQGASTTVTTSESHGLSSGDLAILSCSGQFDGTYQVQAIQDQDDVAILLHFEGDEGGASFIDSSTYNHTVNRNGQPVTVDKNGLISKAGRFQIENEDYLSVDNHSIFDFGNNDFTIECSFIVDEFTGASTEQMNILSYGLSGSSWWALYLYHDFNDTNVYNVTFLFDPTIGGGQGDLDAIDYTIIPGQKYHLSVCRIGTVFSMYIDGVLVDSNDYGLATFNNDSQDFKVGAFNPASTEKHFNGWIDEVIVINGRALRTADFTPPTTAYDDPLLAATTFQILEATLGSPIDSSTFTAFSGTGRVRAGAGIFEGLEHLNDETVAILADGNVLDQQVVNNGSITTSSDYGLVTVGLPFHSQIETLNIELGSDNDTVQGRKIKVGNTSLRFVDSRGGWIGDSEDTLYEAFTNQRVTHNQTELTFNPELTTLNTATALYDGIIRVALGSGYKRGGRVFFEQRDPLPVTITSITPEVAIGGSI